MEEAAVVVAALVTVVTVASLWCLPINLKIRVRTGERWESAE